MGELIEAIGREDLLGLAEGALCKRDPAEAAICEWLANEINHGPDGRGESKAWEIYCAFKGNCPYEAFDWPLLDAFEKAYLSMAAVGGLRLGFKFCDCETVGDLAKWLRHELGCTLWECHN